MKARSAFGDKGKTPLDLMREDLADQYTDLAEDDSLAAKKREASVLFSVAEGHMNNDEASEALKAAGDARNIFKELGDKKCEADSICMIIDAHRLKRS